MCGIFGLMGGIDIKSSLGKMKNTLNHRGPDNYGTWVDRISNIGLGHIRSSIQVLSSSCHQPIFSPSGKWVIRFNSELYNHFQLRRELDKSGININWQGHLDTETLIVLIDT